MWQRVDVLWGSWRTDFFFFGLSIQAFLFNELSQFGFLNHFDFLFSSLILGETVLGKWLIPNRCWIWFWVFRRAKQYDFYEFSLLICRQGRVLGGLFFLCGSTALIIEKGFCFCMLSPSLFFLSYLKSQIF